MTNDISRFSFPCADPPIFSDWWMDDWITHVYGPERTTRATFRVRHLTNYQGTRYEVDQSHANRLDAELAAGKQRIERWLLKQSTQVQV